MTRHVLRKLHPLLASCGWATTAAGIEEHIDDCVVLYRAASLRLTQEQVVTPFSLLGRGSGLRAFRFASFAVRRDTITQGEEGEEDELLRIGAGKIPGNPSGIHLVEWARYIVEETLHRGKSLEKGAAGGGGGETLLLLGDFNFLESEVLGALREASGGEGAGSSFHALQAGSRGGSRGGGGYVTNMSPQLVPDGFGGGPLAPKRIDHIISASAARSGGARERLDLLDASILLPGLEAEVETLTHSGVPNSTIPSRPALGPRWEMPPDLVLKQVDRWQQNLQKGAAGGRGARKKKADGPPTLW